jgi:putative ATP-binding cassette transporter
MKIIQFLLRLSPRACLLSMLLGIVSGACNIGILALISHTLAAGGRPTAATFLWAYGALCVLMPTTRFFSEIVLNQAGQGVVYAMRMNVCRSILSAPLRNLEGVGIHRLYATLTEDIFAITNALVILPVLGLNALLVVGCLAYIAWLSPSVLWVVLGFMAFGVITNQLLLLRSVRYQRLVREGADTLFKYFRSLTEGTKELKIHYGRREMFVSRALSTAAVDLRRYNVSATRFFALSASWGQVLLFLLIGVVLFVLPQRGDFGGPVITGCTLAVLYLMTPLSATLSLFPALTRANVSLKKVEQLGLALQSERGAVGEGDPRALKPVWRSLELAGVTHTYHGEREDESFTLGPIDLALRPGELVFITGGNGSGKTTFAKLLTGLYTPEAGELRLDGKPITDANRESYRQFFSVVFSDFHLFDTALGYETTHLDEKAREYLKQLHLDRKVRFADGKLSTTELSNGQRKRLALLVAYLEDRQIYLFDEWAADQDPQFKELFYYRLLPELKAAGKTVLVISHDDRYYHTADRLVKLDYGQIEYDIKPDLIEAPIAAPLHLKG